MFFLVLIPFPFFSTIVLFKNRIRFPRVFGGFVERRIPGFRMEMDATLRVLLGVSSGHHGVAGLQDAGGSLEPHQAQGADPKLNRPLEGIRFQVGKTWGL